VIKKRLLTPGPTPIHPAVRRAMAGPHPHHRTPEFRQVLTRVRERLKDVFRTGDEVLLLTSSGTGGMEAVLTNLTRPGDKVVVVDSGKFGHRWVDLCRAHGREAMVVTPEARRGASPSDLASAVAGAGGAAAVCFAACESSTGVRADVAGLAAAARRSGGREMLILVDAITEVGAGPLEMKAWDLDAVVGGSQKAFMVPPGLAMVALSARAAGVLEARGGTGLYFDLARELAAQRQGSTAWTPAISLVYGLEAALEVMLAGGIEAIWKGVERRARMTRAACSAMGLEPYALDPALSLTAVMIPAGVDASRLTLTLEQEFGVRVAGGQGDLKGKILRIAHLGYIDEIETLGTLGALGAALARQGFPERTGEALAAAARVMAEAR
jgi:aspartate aminotransferase-like enzyme